MITKPMSVYPNNNALDGTIDNTFEMEIKTSGDTVIYYQIEIFNSDTGATIFTGTKTATEKYNGDILQILVSSGSFSNGIDLTWQATLWGSSSNMLVASGVTQEGSVTTTIYLRQHSSVEANMVLKIGSETRTITDYNYNTGIATIDSAFTSDPVTGTAYKIYTDFIYTPTYFFKSRTTPTVTFVSIDNPITTREYDFSATYAQAEGTNIKYYIFDLYDENNEVIDTSGQIYSSNLTYTFNGFLSGDYNTSTPRIYTLKLTIDNQDDVEIIEELAINVLYPAPSIDASPSVEFLEEYGGAQIVWAKSIQSIGSVEGGDYSFVEDFPTIGQSSLLLSDGSMLIYDNMNSEAFSATEDSTLVMETSLSSSRQGKIVGMIIDDTNEIYIKIDGFNFIFVDVNGVETEIATIVENNYSAFQSYSSPIENTGYFIYDTDNWDTTKYILITFLTTLYTQYRITLKTTEGDILLLSSVSYDLIKSLIDELGTSDILDGSIPIDELDTTIATILTAPSVIFIIGG